MKDSGLHLGFHGCDEEVGERILADKDHLAISTNDYDWLGSGGYVWGYSDIRAQRWAEFVHAHPQHFGQRIKRPFVIGVIYEPGHCLDLSDAACLDEIQEAYYLMVEALQESGFPTPVNQPGFKGDLDLVKRHLDCAVINYVHHLREQQGLLPYDTVRGAFPEGGPLYTDARIMERTHVQICLRSPRQSIRGYFRPMRQTK